jgi:hypothetical protein
MFSRQTIVLSFAALATICCLPLYAAETQPSAQPQRKNAAWVLDRALVRELGVDDAPYPRQLSGRVILRLDPQQTPNGVALVPTTQPSTVEGYLELDLQAPTEPVLKQGRVTLATTRRYVIADEDDLRMQATGDLDHQIRLQWESLELLNSELAREDGGYLGIGVEAPADAMRSQLSLPNGTGLLVNYVAPDGPSHNNIQLHDVLQKLDDQILVNGEQLVTLVRMHKPGDTVRLTLLRHASPVTEQITLGKRPPTDARQAGSGSAPEGLTGLPFVGQLYRNGPHPITFNDGELTATLDGGNLLAIEPASGKTLFQGPIATEEQWKQVPQVVRNKLEAWRSLIAVHQPAWKK